MKQKAEGWQNLAADIPSNYSRLIARELDMTTRQLPVLLRGTGLDVEQFLSEDGLLTLAQQVRILRNALLLSGQPAFGLMLGKRLTPATHGAMGFAASSSPDLLSALRAIQTFLPTRASVIQLHLRQVEEHLFDIGRLQPIGHIVRRPLVGKQVFDASEPGRSRTLEAFSKRRIGK